MLLPLLVSADRDLNVTVHCQNRDLNVTAQMSHLYHVDTNVQQKRKVLSGVDPELPFGYGLGAMESLATARWDREPGWSSEERLAEMEANMELAIETIAALKRKKCALRSENLTLRNKLQEALASRGSQTPTGAKSNNTSGITGTHRGTRKGEVANL
jgi:hypothetical protein